MATRTTETLVSSRPVSTSAATAVSGEASTRNASGDGPSNEGSDARLLGGSPEPPHPSLWKRTWKKAVKRPARRIRKVLGSKLNKKTSTGGTTTSGGITVDHVTTVHSAQNPIPGCQCLVCTNAHIRVAIMGGPKVGPVSQTVWDDIEAMSKSRAEILAARRRRSADEMPRGATVASSRDLQATQDPLFAEDNKPAAAATSSTAAPVPHVPATSVRSLPTSHKLAAATSSTAAPVPLVPATTVRSMPIFHKPRPASYHGEVRSQLEDMANSKPTPAVEPKTLLPGQAMPLQPLESSTPGSGKGKGKAVDDTPSGPEVPHTSSGSGIPHIASVSGIPIIPSGPGIPPNMTYPSDQMFTTWPPTLAEWIKLRDEQQVARQGGYHNLGKDVRAAERNRDKRVNIYHCLRPHGSSAM